MEREEGHTPYPSPPPPTHTPWSGNRSLFSTKYLVVVICCHFVSFHFASFSDCLVRTVLNMVGSRQAFILGINSNIFFVRQLIKLFSGLAFLNFEFLKDSVKPSSFFCRILRHSSSRSSSSLWQDSFSPSLQSCCTYYLMYKLVALLQCSFIVIIYYSNSNIIV